MPKRPRCRCQDPTAVAILARISDREKQGDHAEAIGLALLALSQGWQGDWERRMARCERALAKAAARAIPKKLDRPPKGISNGDKIPHVP